MKTKITKGKWTFTEYFGGDFGVYSENGNGKDVALVRNQFNEHEAKANTKLIAAAPELIRVLNEYIQESKKHIPVHSKAAFIQLKAERLIYDITED